MRSDVCLIMEGSYPYVAGGVSTWVAQILDAMPRLRFSIIYLGGTRDQPRSLKYKIPHNVVEFQEHFLYDVPEQPTTDAPPWPLTPRETEMLEGYLSGLLHGECRNFIEVAAAVKKFPTMEDLFRAVAYSKEIWDIVTRQYEAVAPKGLSFLDFFWTFRSIMLPPLCLLYAPLPEARVFHSASTGYAGFLGARAAQEQDAMLIITEHGLYTRERRIEVFNSQWIQDSSYAPHLDMRRSSSFFKEWWNKFFLSLSVASYRYATRVFSLYEDARQTQLGDGADPEKTEIIPNGIVPEDFVHMPLRQRKPGDPLVIGFIGRITPIKDVKTLLRALGLLHTRKIPFECLFLGPMDEDKAYAAECQSLTNSLGLNSQVSFKGRVNIKEYMPQMDVVVLTSISEGMPFVVLEANCAGVPCVATDVGSCRDLLLGRTPADKALGPSGMVTPVASPGATAMALEQLARSPELCRRMGEAGRQRVVTFFDIRDVMHRYEEVYRT